MLPSTSLPVRVIEVAMSSLNDGTSCAFATGVSLTGVTVIDTVPVSVPPFPSLRV